MAVISSLLSLQSGYVDEEKYLEMFRESQSRIKSMALVHEKLYQSDNFAHIDVQDYIKSLAENLRSSFCTSDRDIKLNINVFQKYRMAFGPFLNGALPQTPPFSLPA